MEIGTPQHALMARVQHNCHISDARYAGNYTMCIYLMKMREFYRWEHGYAFADPLPNEEIGQWLRQRESLWEEVEEQEFQVITTEQGEFAPFEVAELNTLLEGAGLIYGAGLGLGARPHFFLAELEQRYRLGECTVHLAGRELARDLTSPPAMSQGKEIYIRRESLRRYMWERLENWNWNQPDNAMAAALRHFDVEGQLEQALDAMTELELQTVLQHELGEIQAGELLGEAWHELLMALPRSRVEFMARAVRDLLADSLTTLPYLLQAQHAPSLHLYMANLTGMRLELAPGLKRAYEHWVLHGDLGPLDEYALLGRQHWLHTARSLLDIYRTHGLDGMSTMQALLQASSH